ncbi:hypothetical protein NSP_14880 [Nodularia spumigena CCY9414]|nr:hypothetical protein NSP_14880 [Nodularia spumigena CCY9414]
MVNPNNCQIIYNSSILRVLLSFQLSLKAKIDPLIHEIVEKA